MAEKLVPSCIKMQAGLAGRAKRCGLSVSALARSAVLEAVEKLEKKEKAGVHAAKQSPTTTERRQKDVRSS